MKKDLFDIIREKSYEELSAVEREEFAEMVTDAEQYEELQGFMHEVDVVATEEVIPSIRVKEDLNDLFEQVHGQRKYAWYMSFAAVLVPKDKPLYQQPLFYAAAMLLLVLLVVPFANKNLTGSTEVLAQKEVAKEEVVSSVDDNKISVEVPVSTNVETRTTNHQSKSEVVMEDANSVSGFSAIEGGLAEEEMSEAESDVMEFDMNISTTISAPVPTSTAVNHPDGVFEDWATVSNYSVPASKQPELLDLLTATF